MSFKGGALNPTKVIGSTPTARINLSVHRDGESGPWNRTPNPPESNVHPENQPGRNAHCREFPGTRRMHGAMGSARVRPTNLPPFAAGRQGWNSATGRVAQESHVRSDLGLLRVNYSYTQGLTLAEQAPGGPRPARHYRTNPVSSSSAASTVDAQRIIPHDTTPSRRVT